ncbi:metallophosphoesterase [Psychrobacillus sp. FSL H8-0510]|uniref:metallophosphoesterase n=1 Tax=Psychrobacillus sp. FSL H8-0510 TaxID=2921394 RepID=UPI0030FB1E5A
MKIGHLSDLHLDINQEHVEEDIVKVLCNTIKEKDWDILLISGDISNHMDDTLSILHEIEKQTGRPVHFVPGNHDLARTISMGSDDVLASYLADKSVPIGKPAIYGDIAIVGALGWYDYSYGPHTHTAELLARLKGSLWYDGGHINFKDGDIDISERFLRQLADDLAKVKDKQVWVMTHFVPYESNIRYIDATWNICNAYMGSESVGELLDIHENVRYVSFGHTHTRAGVKESDQKTIVLNPLGYFEEWKTDSFEKELENVFVIVEWKK